MSTWPPRRFPLPPRAQPHARLQTFSKVSWMVICPMISSSELTLVSPSYATHCTTCRNTLLGTPQHTARYTATHTCHMNIKSRADTRATQHTARHIIPQNTTHHSTLHDTPQHAARRTATHCCHMESSSELTSDQRNTLHDILQHTARHTATYCCHMKSSSEQTYEQRLLRMCTLARVAKRPIARKQKR